MGEPSLATLFFSGVAAMIVGFGMVISSFCLREGGETWITEAAGIGLGALGTTLFFAGAFTALMSAIIHFSG